MMNEAAIFVIAFVAAGCPPCDKFKREAAGLDSPVRIVVVDVKDRPDLARQCNVKITPTFVAVAPGERQIARMSGYTSRQSLRVWLARQAEEGKKHGKVRRAGNSKLPVQ